MTVTHERGADTPATSAEQEVVMDTSDVQRWVGVPVGGQQPKEPFSVNDVRRFVQGVQNPHPLYFDDDYAAASRFGGIVAPQSYFGGGPGTGATPAIQGTIPGSHMLFGGDEFWFYGPRIYPGDLIRMDRMLYDFAVKQTSFAGPTMFSRGDTTYVNQRGEFIAKQRSTAIRYLVEEAIKRGSMMSQTDEPNWSDEQLEEIEEQKVAYIRSYVDLAHQKRLWDSVTIGEQLPTRVIGPHSVQSFTTESRTDQGGWGSYHHSDDPYASTTMQAGWLPEMSRNEERTRVNPGAGDGLVYGPSRGHVQPRWAKVIGMPRGYGYGATMGAWTTDYLTNWAGEWGFLRHANTQYRFPALTGDVTFMTGEVTNKWTDPPTGRAVVELTYAMRNQAKALMASGRAEIELPLE